MQELLAVNKKAPSRHKAINDYLLTTKLYCGDCMSFMVGESGNARGRRYTYYKCVNTKRNHKCNKKPVKKDWIENIVIDTIVKYINNEKFVDKIIKKNLKTQGNENPSLSILKKELSQTNKSIANMINAIEQGIITPSTKERLNELENAKSKLETEIAKEKLKHPLITKEFLDEWFDNIKGLDKNNVENRRMLIDTFVNSVILYDDRIDFYFNYKENVESLSFAELEYISDFNTSTPPKNLNHFGLGFFQS